MSEPPSEPELRMAVIGCGPIGNLHAAAIAGSSRATLTAVCDVDARRAAETADRFGAVAYTDVRQLFEHQRLDAVTIATPDHLHVEPALAALAAGCHVFCEKPLAATLDDAQRMADASARQRRWLAVDYNRRFAFGYRTARQLCDQGAIGAVRHNLLSVSDRTPGSKVARHPHVIFTTLLTHHLDLLRYFQGEICQITAHAAQPPTADLLREVQLALTMADGTIATIVACYRDGQSRTVERMELSGTTGSIIVHDVTRRVELRGIDSDAVRTFEPNPFSREGEFYDSLAQHVAAFIQSIADGRQPPVTAIDGLAGMRLATAAIESLRANTPIEVPTP